MGQYRSRWTGEVIDDAVDKVRKIAYINLNGNSQEAYEAAETAYSAGFDIVARYDRNMGSGTLVQSFELLCVLRQQTKNSSQQTATYYWFRNFPTHTSLKLAFKLGCDYGSTTATREDVTATYPWEATQETLGIQEQAGNKTATHSISQGEYVFFGDYLTTADRDIAVGEDLWTTGNNKNLTRITNGGLNELKSAITDSINNALMPFMLTSNSTVRMTFDPQQTRGLILVGGIDQNTMYPVMIGFRINANGNVFSAASPPGNTSFTVSKYQNFVMDITNTFSYSVWAVLFSEYMPTSITTIPTT